MPYDSSLDKQIFSESWSGDNTKITVSIYSYNNGPNKMQLARENMLGDGNYRFTKLGRLSKEEVEGVLPLIQQAREKM
ncbi:MAG: hypothetical protein GF375_05545 [Candidatus Omnitrophica bacterium]|nr:hypothetical protein [Candidatus Omnitrophota bacterium]MBD3269452.1 hypothetical protein [Candidatus Omnitrophota bacterium]